MKKAGTLLREGLLSQIKNGVEKRNNTFVISYSKLSGPKMNDLRKNLKQVGAEVFVSRNTIARIALKQLKFEKLGERINGQTAFIWSNADAVEISKRLVKFAKDHQGLVVQGGLLEGTLLEKTDIQKLSDLPSREVLLGQLLGTLQSPISRLMGALNGKTRELLYLLHQLSEQKGGK